MERYSDFVIPLLIPLNLTMVLQRERERCQSNLYDSLSKCWVYRVHIYIYTADRIIHASLFFLFG